MTLPLAVRPLPFGGQVAPIGVVFGPRRGLAGRDATAKGAGGPCRSGVAHSFQAVVFARPIAFALPFAATDYQGCGLLQIPRPVRHQHRSPVGGQARPVTNARTSAANRSAAPRARRSLRPPGRSPALGALDNPVHPGGEPYRRLAPVHPGTLCLSTRLSVDTRHGSHEHFDLLSGLTGTLIQQPGDRLRSPSSWLRARHDRTGRRGHYRRWLSHLSPRWTAASPPSNPTPHDVVAAHSAPALPRSGIRLVRTVLRLGEVAGERVHLCDHALRGAAIELVELC